MGLRHLLQSAARIIALGAVLCSFTRTAVGQQNSGAVAGQVIGLSGKEISGAPIQAKSVESGQTFKTASSVNGSYSFMDLPFGKYEISSPVAGFERRSVDVRAGETIRIDIHFVEMNSTLGTVGDGDAVSRIATYNRPAPQPWTRKQAYELQPNHEVDEYVCNENNLDPVNMIGK